MDEAHKTVGHGKKPMAHLIHQKNIKVKNRLFMTATERLFKGDVDEYLSMDDPRDYGKIIYQLSFKEAINSKPPIISDYKVITFGISEPEIEEVYKSNKYIQVKKEIKNITAREFATAIALRKAIKKLKISNAISFHRSILRAKNFRQQQELITKVYPDYQPIKTFHVSGEMPTNQRSSQMRLFAESKGLMTNARCLTEGVDLPAIDCVCFTDPKRSKVDIVQATGRALRLSKDKKFGYILIPIFVSKSQNPNEAAEDSGFEEVIATVGALSTQDTRIADYLRAVTKGEIPRGGNPIDGITKVNVLTKVDSDVFEKSIQLKIWDKIARTNFRPYEEAKKFVHKIKLKSAGAWGKFTKTKKLPKDIPASADRKYKNRGWISWGDFLGTGRIADRYRKYESFKEARKYARSLKVNYAKDWKKIIKSKKNKPSISRKPWRTYKNDWKGWGDFLGSNVLSNWDKSKQFLNYSNARKLCIKSKIKSSSHYAKLKRSGKLSTRLPAAPDGIYKNKGWKGWEEFLGTGKYNWKFLLNYDQAKRIVRNKNFKSISEWRKYNKGKISKSLKIPTNPNSVYKNRGWKGWSDFLGIDIISTRSKSFLNLSEAKKIVRNNNIKNTTNYENFYKKFRTKKNDKFYFLPSDPKSFYGNKWKGFNDFLEKGFLNYKEAKNLIKNFKFRNMSNYKRYLLKNKKLRYKLPLVPRHVYKDSGWKGSRDFLGTG